jgi:UDPglucose 6-dehydrogenase
VMSGNPLIFMDRRSAEVTKYAANSFLAAKISFMNEVANLCELVGADVDNVRKGIGSDSRIGKRFLFPGVGYGGSCFPKDVSALYKTAQQYGYGFRILGAVMQVNDRQKEILVKKIQAHYGADLTGKTFAIWGLAFKPNTDDIREAPALVIIEQLIRAGATIRAYDPEAMAAVQTYHPNLPITYTSTPYEALSDADALVIVTEWNEFRAPDFAKLRKMLKQPVIFDGRNLYEVDDIANEGFSYYSIGRKSITA